MRHPSSERLRLARQRRYEHGADAARAAGIKAERYRAWENDVTGNGVPYDGACLMAPLFGVSPEWIMRGVGLGPDGAVIPDPSNEPGIPRDYLLLAGEVLALVLQEERMTMADSDRIEALIQIATLLLNDGIPTSVAVSDARKALSKGVVEAFLKGRGIRRHRA